MKKLLCYFIFEKQIGTCHLFITLKSTQHTKLIKQREHIGTHEGNVSGNGIESFYIIENFYFSGKQINRVIFFPAPTKA